MPPSPDDGQSCAGSAHKGFSTLAILYGTPRIIGTVSIIVVPLLATALLLSQNPQPWKPPFETVERPVDYTGFVGRLDQSGTGVFARGERLTFLAKGKENPFGVPDWLELEFVRDETADLWVAQIRMKEASQAFFGYNLKQGGKSVRASFFGPRAPKTPNIAKALVGTIETIPFESKALGESRDVTMYLPPHPKPGLNAVYMADGQSCAAFAKVLEPLILAKRVAPTAIVGLHHGAYTGDIGHYDFQQDFRAREYLKILDPERFDLHLRFVTEEVAPWAESRFGLASGAAHRALFGFSNGAAFALVASSERPDFFGAVLPFSVAVYDRDALKVATTGKRLPTYWLAAGTMEPFVQATGEAERILRESGAEVRFERYVSGHDEAMWQLAFAQTLPKVFSYRR